MQHAIMFLVYRYARRFRYIQLLISVVSAKSVATGEIISQ